MLSKAVSPDPPFCVQRESNAAEVDGSKPMNWSVCDKNMGMGIWRSGCGGSFGDCDVDVERGGYEDGSEGSGGQRR